MSSQPSKPATKHAIPKIMKNEIPKTLAAAIAPPCLGFEKLPE